MSNFHADNVALVTLRMKQFAANEAKREVLKRMRNIAQRMVDYIDNAFGPFNPPAVPYAGNGQFPVWVGQMHDATGVGIYDDGRLDGYLPTKKALDSQPQMDMAHNDFNIIGNERLREALAAGAGKFNKGLWLVLFCAVPYAEIVEDMGSSKGRGKGFFTWLWDIMSIDIKKEFEGCIIAPMIGLSDSIPF